MLTEMRFERRLCACGLNFLARVGLGETRCFFCTEYEPLRKVKPPRPQPAKPVQKRRNGKAYVTSEAVRRNARNFYQRHREEVLAAVKARNARKSAAKRAGRDGAHAKSA